jgi:hypothetical protein
MASWGEPSGVPGAARSGSRPRCRRDLRVSFSLAFLPPANKMRVKAVRGPRLPIAEPPGGPEAPGPRGSRVRSPGSIASWRDTRHPVPGAARPFCGRCRRSKAGPGTLWVSTRPGARRGGPGGEARGTSASAAGAAFSCVVVTLGRHDHLAVENFGMGLDGSFHLTRFLRSGYCSPLRTGCLHPPEIMDRISGTFED